MARKDFYKLYQLSNVLISKYEYRQILIDEFKAFYNVEAWFVSENNYYNLIRVTFNPASDINLDINRINTYINYLSTNLNMDINFLDIHISNDKYDKDIEKFDYINIEENYSDGIDLHERYPEIYEAVHNVEDQEKEIISIAKQIQSSIEERRKQFLRKHRPIGTYITIALCIIIYAISVFMSKEYSENSVYIFLGASYTTFTLGLKQYYRLLTAGFVHGGLLHLLTNMFSLYYMGSFVERKYGTLRYFISLFVSIIIGTLCQVILSGNTIVLGISGGLYAFMVMYLISALSENRINFYQIIPLILINLSINFLSTTAWLAHLGGLITGYLFYLIYSKQNNKGYIALLIVLFGVLMFKFISIDTISPLYGGTDQEILDMLNDLGFKEYASKLLIRLIEVYNKYGG